MKSSNECVLNKLARFVYDAFKYIVSHIKGIIVFSQDKYVSVGTSIHIMVHR